MTRYQRKTRRTGIYGLAKRRGSRVAASVLTRREKARARLIWRTPRPRRKRAGLSPRLRQRLAVSVPTAGVDRRQRKRAESFVLLLSLFDALS